ncbi:MAG: HNH endonuclease [Epsilonproteobacteria bacterium]|nr:HNH endonuclease [Campylobacterota bacterium]
MIVKRICLIHGLYTKTKDNKSGCPKCKQTKTREYDKNYRNKESDKFYHSREWRRVRGLQLSRFPLCKMCGHPANIVDHIQEIKDGGVKLSLKNLQSLCTSCHNIKTNNQKQSRVGVVKSPQLSHASTELRVKFLQSSTRGGRVR